jgi:hypothetical protein
MFILKLSALVVLALAGACQGAPEDTISFTGAVRTDATFTSCRTGCKLGPANTDADHAQWAAVLRNFTVTAPSTMEAKPMDAL